jgi:hypothetical protein
LLGFVWICTGFLPRPILILHFWQERKSGNDQTFLVTCTTLAWLLEVFSLVSLVLGEPIARATAAALFLLANALFLHFMRLIETMNE